MATCSLDGFTPSGRSSLTSLLSSLTPSSSSSVYPSRYLQALAPDEFDEAFHASVSGSIAASASSLFTVPSIQHNEP